MYKILVLFILFFLISCQKNSTEQEKLSDIYIELLTIDQKYSGASDSIKFYKKNFLSKFNITEDEYLTSLRSIGENKEEWENFFKLVYEKLDTLKARAERVDSIKQSKKENLSENDKNY